MKKSTVLKALIITIPIIIGILAQHIENKEMERSFEIKNKLEASAKDRIAELRN